MKTLNQLLTACNDRIIFSCVAGSRANGTQVPGSDEDVRGIYMVPSAAYLPIDREPVQLSDDRNNTVYYSLRRCIELLAEANPNILELLFSPQDCVQIISKEMEQLILARSIFVTRQCGDTRALLACRWIRQNKSQPPTEFHIVVEHVASFDERTYFADLIARKRNTPEKGEIVIEPNRGKAISAELESYERNPVPSDVSPNASNELLDATLRRWMGEVL